MFFFVFKLFRFLGFGLFSLWSASDLSAVFRSGSSTATSPRHGTQKYSPDRFRKRAIVGGARPPDSQQFSALTPHNDQQERPQSLRGPDKRTHSRVVLTWFTDLLILFTVYLGVKFNYLRT